MFEHLNQNQIEAYRRQQLSAEELLSVSDHLVACGACRGRVERALGETPFFSLQSQVFDQTEESASAGMHPAFELIARYVDGMPETEDLQEIQDHLTICESCSMSVADLRSFRNEIAPGLTREVHPAPSRDSTRGWSQRLYELFAASGLRSPFVLRAALAMVLIAVSGLFVWQARPERETGNGIASAPPSPEVTPMITTPPPAREPEVSAAPMVAQLRDGPGRVSLIGDGRLTGVDHLSPRHQEMVREWLTDQQLRQSPLLAGLNRLGSSLMGRREPPEGFSVIEPVGKVMLTDRPTFRWTPLEGATDYVIEVYDESFTLAAASSRLADSSWTPPEPLKRGEVYSWQVKAVGEGRELSSPHPPAQQARFRILSQAKLDELTKAQQAYASSHLILGLLYVDAGLLDEAEGEFRLLQRANPDSTLVVRLLKEVQRLRG